MTSDFKKTCSTMFIHHTSS